MIIYDFIVIGGGIAGLNCVEKLQNKNFRGLLCERSNELGGRIKTIKNKFKNIKYQYEAGAARFNNTHKILMKLIQKYKLKKFMVPITNERKYIQIKNNNKQQFNFKKLSTKVLKNQNKLSKIELQKITFYDYIKKILNKDEIYFYTNYFSYYSEIYISNAYIAIKILKKDFNLKKQFYMLSCGLSKLVELISKNFKKNGGKIKLNKNFINYEKENNLYKINFEDGKSEYTKKLILAIPKYSLINIKNLKPLKKLFNTVKSQPLYRIYAIYPKKNGKVWFENIEKTVTDNKLKFIIPYNTNIGLLHVSYTDGKYAKNLFKKKLNNTIQKELDKNLKLIYPNIKIPKPLLITHHYWPEGACYFTKGVNIDQIYKKIIKPFPKEHVYICGENFSLRQAWMEGALVTSNLVIKKIK